MKCLKMILMTAVLGLIWVGCGSGSKNPRKNPSGCIAECKQKYGHIPGRYDSCREMCVKYSE